VISNPQLSNSQRFEWRYCCTAAVSIMVTTIATALSTLSSNTTNIQQMAKPSLSLIVNSVYWGCLVKWLMHLMNKISFYEKTILLPRLKEYLNA
jgi:hypothetical protein